MPERRKPKRVAGETVTSRFAPESVEGHRWVVISRHRFGQATYRLDVIDPETIFGDEGPIPGVDFGEKTADTRPTPTVSRKVGTHRAWGIEEAQTNHDKGLDE